MPARTITSANSAFTLSVPGVFAVPVALQQYAADEAFDNEAVDSAEAVMGVDGFMAAGFTPFPVKMSITLQADSASIDAFNDWLGAMQAAKEVFYAVATIDMPSVGRSFALSQGALTKGKIIPGAKKKLEPVNYEITWGSVVPSLTQ